MKRTIEFFLSLTGSLLGVVASIFALVIAYLDLFFHLIRYFEMISDLLVEAWVSLILSCIGFTASIVVLFKPKLSSVLLFVSGGGLICIDWFYLIPAILMIIPGIMVFVRKERRKERKKKLLLKQFRAEYNTKEPRLAVLLVIFLF